MGHILTGILTVAITAIAALAASLPAVLTFGAFARGIIGI